MAFLAEQRIAAVSRSERDNLARFGEVADVLVLGVAWPGGVLLVRRQGGAHRVQSLHEIAVGTEHLEDSGSDARHDMHIDDNVW